MLVTRLQVRTMTLTSALSSLNLPLPCKCVARFIVVIKNILKVFPRMIQAISLYHFHPFFAIKGINGQPTNSPNLLKFCLCAERLQKVGGPPKNLPKAHWRLSEPLTTIMKRSMDDDLKANRNVSYNVEMFLSYQKNSA